MTLNKKPILNHLIGKVILLAVGLMLLCIGTFSLLRGKLNSFFSYSWIVVGLGVLGCGIQSLVRIFGGKSVIEEIVSLPLPGLAVHELTIPIKMSKGRVILFFQDTTERDTGKITLSKPAPPDPPSVTASLKSLKPFRIRVPKWSPTSDAGNFTESWPRRTGQSTDPVVMDFLFPVGASERLRIEFELSSNFKGTKLEHKFPISGSETIRVIVKS